jgi:hypothetical protein
VKMELWTYLKFDPLWTDTKYIQDNYIYYEIFLRLY